MVTKKTTVEVLKKIGEPNVDVSFKINQNDIIDALIYEEQERIEAEIEVVKVEYCKIQKECHKIEGIIREFVPDKIKKDNAVIIRYLKKHFGKCEDSCGYKGYLSLDFGDLYVSFKKKPNLDNDEEYQKLRKERDGLQKKLGKISGNLHELGLEYERSTKSKKKLKSKIVRDQLEKTETGKKFLDDFKSIKADLKQIQAPKV